MPAKLRIGVILGIFILFLSLNYSQAQVNMRDSAEMDNHLTEARRACVDQELNTACLGGGSVQTNANDFTTVGDQIELLSVTQVSTQPADDTLDDWGMLIFKLPAGLDDQALTMVAVGQATLTNTYDSTLTIPTCNIFNRNRGEVNIQVAPDNASAVLSLLPAQSKILTSGQYDAAAPIWYRVEDNGQIGWVSGDLVRVVCEENATPNSVSTDDVSILYQNPMQQFTLETGSFGADEAVNGLFLSSPVEQYAHILVNNTQIDIAGDAFVYMEGESTLSIIALQGFVDVSAMGKTVTLRGKQTTSVNLENYRASGEPSDATTATLMNLPDILNSVLKGQTYGGMGTTLSGFEVKAETLENVVRVDMGFTADASLCNLQETSAVDIVFAIDASSTLVNTRQSLLQAALAKVIQDTVGSQARYGITAFREHIIEVTPILGPTDLSEVEANLVDALQSIQRDDSGTNSRYYSGLSSALTMLKQVREDANRQVVVLISDGTSLDPQSALDIAGILSERNIEIYTLAIGAEADLELLGQLANDEGRALSIADDAEILRTMTDLKYNLTQSPIAQNFSLKYSIDTQRFQVDEKLLALSGAKLADNQTIEWTQSLIRDGQRLEAALLLRAIGELGEEVGTAEVSYECQGENEPQSPAPILTKLNPPQEVETLSDQIGLLTFDQIGEGSLTQFDETLWGIDVGENQLFSVTTTGFFSPPTLLIANPTIQPLYSITETDDSDAAQYTFAFYVPEGGLQWLLLQSQASSDYTIEINAGISDEGIPALELDGATISLEEVNTDAQIYSLDASEGQLVTFRYSGESTTTIPLQVVSLDGHTANTIIPYYDSNDFGQWVIVQELKGAGPYRVIVNATEPYDLEVASGDTFSIERGELHVDDVINQNYDEETSLMVRYAVILEETQDVSVVLSEGASSLILTDENSQALTTIESLSVSGFTVGRYQLSAGKYNLYTEINASYTISIIEVEDGNLVDSLGTLKGTAFLNETQQGAFEEDDPLIAVYNLSDTTTKAIREGEVVTIRMSNVPNASLDTVFIRSADGLVSEIMREFSQPGESLYSSVHELKGQAPYRVIISGLQEYVLTVRPDDELSNDKGALIVGQPIATSSSEGLQELNYTLTPDIGDFLEGDVVTVTFRSLSTIDNEFFETPVLRNGDEEIISIQDQITTETLFVGVYELQGSDPYIITIPNVGPYEISLDINNQLLLEQGDIQIDDDLYTGFTEGTQIVQYTLREAKEGDIFTVYVNSPGGSFYSGDFNIEVQNAEGLYMPTPTEAVQVISSPGDIPQETRVAKELFGEGPYIISFTMNGQFSVELVNGDQVVEDKDVFYVGDAEVVQLEDEENEQVLVYSFDVTEPDAQLSVLTDTGFRIYDPNGDQIYAQYSLHSYDGGNYQGTIYNFKFSELGTYRYWVLPFGREQYILQIAESDQMTVHKGDIFFGITETDLLDRNKRFATYTLPAAEGDTITVRLDMEDFRLSRELLRTETITIFDAEGNPVKRSWRIRDDGYNLFVYELEGPAPYTLRVQPQRRGDFWSAESTQLEYQLLVDLSDTAKTEMGALTLGNQLEVKDFTREEGRRTRIYELTIDEANQGVTFELTPELAKYLAGLRVYDENDKRVFPNTTKLPDVGDTLVQNRVEKYAFSFATPGKYRVEFEVAGPYKLNVLAEDKLTANYGELTFNDLPPAQFDEAGNPIEADYEPISYPAQRLLDEQKLVRYTIPATDDRLISVSVQGTLREGVSPRLYDVNGKQLFLRGRSLENNLGYFVFQMSGEGPYRLELEPTSRDHTITLYHGNIMVAELGTLRVYPPSTSEDEDSPAINTSLLKPAQIGIYRIDKPEGDTITLLLEQDSDFTVPHLLFNGDSDILLGIDAVSDEGSLLKTYKLIGPGPYDLLFIPEDKYTILLTEGDVLTSEQGAIRVEQDTEFINVGEDAPEPPPPLELLPPARLARHTIDDLLPGRFITVVIENEGVDLRRRLFFQDSKENYLRAEISDYQNEETNILVFLLSGEPPYTIFFPALEEYTIRVINSDLVRLNEGRITFVDEAVEDDELVKTAPILGRLVTYTIFDEDLKPKDNQITIVLQDGNNPGRGILRDANGQLWSPRNRLEANQKLYSFYEISGPAPYEVILLTEGEYLVRIENNNLLREIFDPPSFEEPNTGQLESPRVVAVYPIPTDKGETISVQLLQGGTNRIPYVILRDDGIPLIPVEVGRNNDSYAVYDLLGSDSFTLEFAPTGRYTLNIKEGNVLRLPIENPILNDTYRESMDPPAEIGLYPIDRAEGDIISLVVSNGDFIGGELFDSEHKLIEPDATSTQTRDYLVYTLEGEAPYTFEFPANRNYEIEVRDGNILRVDKGLIRFGNEIKDTITTPQRGAVYIIDSQNIQVLSLSLQDGNGALQGQLIDSNGVELLPRRQEIANNRTYSTFDLTGTAPYEFIFYPAQGRQYTLKLTEGDIFKTQFGVLPFGVEVDGKLDVPAKTAAYTINTSPDQVISVTIQDDRAESVKAQLFDATGTEILPRAEVSNGRRYSWVYDLVGTAPYSFEFDHTNPYKISLERGDMTQVEFDPIGPEAPLEPKDGDN